MRGNAGVSHSAPGRDSPGPAPGWAVLTLRGMKENPCEEILLPYAPVHPLPRLWLSVLVWGGHKALPVRHTAIRYPSATIKPLPNLTLGVLRNYKKNNLWNPQINYIKAALCIITRLRSAVTLASQSFALMCLVLLWQQKAFLLNPTNSAAEQLSKQTSVKWLAMLLT